MKTTCSKVRKKFNRYIDDRLNEKEKGKISLHLKNCPRCKKDIHDLLNVNKLLKEIEQPSIPCNTIEKIKHIPKTRAEKVKILRFKEKLRPVPVAASILLTIFLAVFAGEQVTGVKESPEIPAEYHLAQESLYTLWEEIRYER